MSSRRLIGQFGLALLLGMILPTVGVSGEVQSRARGGEPGGTAGIAQGHVPPPVGLPPEDLIEVPGETAAGGTTVNLQGRFQTTITLRRNADGSVSQHCESTVRDSRASE